MYFNILIMLSNDYNTLHDKIIYFHYCKI